MATDSKEPTLAMLPWFARDYIAATREMTLAERGAYTDLLFFSWDKGPLVADTARLARMIGAHPAEFAEMWEQTLRFKFVETPDGLINERLERERVRAKEMRSNAKERAARGGNSTRQKWQQDPQGMAASMAASKAASQATTIAASQATSLPQARPQARLEQGSPSPSPSPSPAKTPSEARVTPESDVGSGTFRRVGGHVLNAIARKP